MKTFTIQGLLLLMLCYHAASFEVTPFDSSSVLGLFSRSGSLNVLKLDPSVGPISDDVIVEKRISFQPIYFEEHCAIKCLRNLNCVRYSMLNGSICQLSLKANYQRQKTYPEDQTASLASKLSCNLQTCANSVYCSDSAACLCPVSLVTATTSSCGSKVVYEFSEWSAWSACTAACDEGFQSKTRKCIRKYIDTTTNSLLKSEIVEGMDYLCGTDSRVETKTCKLDSCRIYGDWSSWTPCSKICGGFSTRQRDCLPGKTCDQKFLRQSRVCGFEDCSSLVISNLIKL